MKYPWYWPKWQHDLWKVQRRNGKQGFMLKQALPWGLFMFFVVGLTSLWARSNRGEAVTIEDVFIQVVIFSFGGLLYGVGSWYFGEKLFSKYSDV